MEKSMEKFEIILIIYIFDIICQIKFSQNVFFWGIY